MLAGLAMAAVMLAAVPPDDIGIVFRSSAGTAELVAACPRTAVVETSTGGAALVGSFLAACPGSEAVFQLPPVPLTPLVVSPEDARVRAGDYWTVIAAGALAPFALASPAERAATWLGGPPAFDSSPSWRTDPACNAGALFCAADYVGAFWAELDRLARADGYRGLVLPPFSARPEDRPDALCRLLAGVDRATPADVAWTYDAVSPGLAQSAAAEATTTFGYRGLRATCVSARVHPLLVRVSVAGGWRTRGVTTAELIDWLSFLDREVDADPEPFLGLAVYGFGTGDAHDLAPISSELAAFLMDGTLPDGGGGDNGGQGPPPAPPDEPGSNLGPDSGRDGGGCSTAGGGALALLGLALVRLSRKA